MLSNRRRSARSRCASGFTLVELMMTIAILGLLIMLATPNFRAFLANQRIRAKAEEIMNGVQLARVEAVRRNSRVRLTTQPDGSWVVGCVTVTDECPAAIQRGAASETWAKLTYLYVPDDADSVTFLNSGLLDRASNPFSSVQVDVDLSLMTAAESRELRVTVGNGGVIRMCDPSLPVTDFRAC